MKSITRGSVATSRRTVILLFGEWWEADPTQRETWLIQLVPKSE
jgi:hypothetical protein